MDVPQLYRFTFDMFDTYGTSCILRQKPYFAEMYAIIFCKLRQHREDRGMEERSDFVASYYYNRIF